MHSKVKGETVLVGIFIGLIIGASFLRMLWGPESEEPQVETICICSHRVIELDQSDLLYGYELRWVPEEYLPEEYCFEKVLLIIPK